MTIEIVDFPINHGDFPVRYVKLPEGKQKNVSPISDEKMMTAPMLVDSPSHPDSHGFPTKM